MKQKLILMACLLFGGILMSQSVPKALEDWKTTAGTQNFFYKNLTKTDPSGNVIVAGATMSNGAPDILIAKYNTSGSLLWMQQFSGAATNGVDFSGGLYVDDPNYIYLTGTISNNTVTPETDCITMKLASSTGSVVWSSTYTGSAGGYDGGKNVTVDASNNVYVSGLTYNSSFNSDFLILKYNSSGAQQWVQTWDYVGGDDASVKVAVSGASVTVGGAVTTTTTNAYKLATLRLSSTTGSLLATNIGAAVTTTSVDVVCDMILDNTTGDILIAGSNSIGGQGTNFYVQKLSSTLVTAWTYTYNGSSSLDDVAKAIGVDASGNVYIAGYSTSSTLGKDVTLIKLNSSGVNQWTQTSGFTGNDEAADLVIDANNDAYVTGYRTSTTSLQNYYTAKYSSAGTKTWEVEMDGSILNDYATNMALNADNSVIITGQSETSPGNFDFLTTKYVQKDVITPTDFNGESPVTNFMYYRNSGQLIAATSSLTLVPSVKFYTNNTYPSFYFKKNGQSFVFARLDTLIATNDTLHRIDLDFNKSNTSTGTYPMDAQDNGYLNYFLAQTGGKGIVNVQGNQRLITPDLYTNIDLMCSSNQNGIKYYFIVKPGGNPSDIQMEFTGASSFNLNGTTNALTINSSIGSLTYDRPTVYQLTAGNATVAVTGWTADWQTNGASNKYKFNSGAYTSSLTLIIEVDQGNSVSSNAAINNLNWCTYYGGGSDDVFYDVKTNSSNNVWVTGYTRSTNFPTSSGSYQGTNAGNADAILVKFNTSGVRQWSTYVGGSNDEAEYHIHGIEVDNSGNSYAAFKTASANFPTSPSTASGAYYDNTNPGNSVAIVELNNAGQLVWSTFFGGSNNNETTYDLGLDQNNNLFVTGTGSGIPILNPSGSYSSTFGLTEGCYIAKFDLNHNLKWSSYIGDVFQYVEKVTFASNNDIILVGEVNNDPKFGGGPTSAQLFDLKNPGGSTFYNGTYNGGAYDGIIMKFNGSTNDLTWSTYYGGDQNDYIHGTIVDNNDNLYLTGATVSASSLISGNSFGYNNTTYNGSGSYFSSQTIGDGFLAKFTNTGQFTSSTYFGGAANEGSFDITYKNDRIFAPFTTAGNDMPFYSGNPPTAFVKTTHSDGQDVSNDGYITALDKNLNLKWTSYFGGTNTLSAYSKSDEIYSNTCSNDFKYYIVGVTSSASNFPLVNSGISGAYFQGTKSSSADAFIAQFDIATSLVSVKNNEASLLNGLNVYPNPAINEITVDFKATSDYNIQIIDIFGREVKSVENQKNQLVKIDVSGIAKGAYIIKAFDKNNTAVAKVIIN